MIASASGVETATMIGGSIRGVEAHLGDFKISHLRLEEYANACIESQQQRRPRESLSQQVAYAMQLYRGVHLPTLGNTLLTDDKFSVSHFTLPLREQ